MAAELPRPGVEVIQVFRTVSPTVVTPTLPPCVVGACKQIVDATVQSASGSSITNTDALVTVPASFTATPATGTPPEYTLSAGALQFSVNNHPSVTVTFAAGTYKPIDVVAKVKTALAAATETAAYAEVAGTETYYTGTSWRLRTLGKTRFDQISIDPNGLTFGSIIGSIDLTTLILPADLNGLTLILSVDGGANLTVTFAAPANPAAVLAQINAVLLLAATATQTVAPDPLDRLRITTTLAGATGGVTVIGGTSLAVLGLTIGQSNFGVGSTPAIAAAFGFNSEDIFFGAESYAEYELDIPTTAFPDPRNNLDEISFETSSIRAFLDASGGGALTEELRTSCLLRKGGAVAASDDGNGDNLTPFLDMAGEDFTSLVTVPTQADAVAAGAPNFALLSNKTVVMSDGRAPRTVQFGTLTTIADVISDIEKVWNVGDGIDAINNAGNLQLTVTKKREDGVTTALGEDSQLVIYGGTGIVPTNHLDTGVVPVLTIGRTVGLPQAAAVGDEVWVDGVFVGKIVQVAPNGFNTRLKVDKQVPLTFTGASFYIVAKGLAALPAQPVTRPSPNLIVNSWGDVRLKLGLLRDTMGKVVEAITTTALIPGQAPTYISYKALRLDVTQKAADPGILRFNDTIQLSQLLSPISPDNPLGLGLFFALLNAPAIQCLGLGVDQVSPQSPFGTPESYSRAASYLEAFEVYGIAPLTHESTVGQIFKTHVDVMSAPENKGERIVVFNPSKPTNKLDKLVASGTNGNTVGATGLEFDTGVGNLAALLLAQGIDPTAAIPVSAGLFVAIASNSNHYSVASISGSVVTITVTFAPGENDDGFYSTTDFNDPPLPGALIEEPFALRLRGVALVLTDGSPDMDGIADTYSDLGRTFQDRRYWQTAPDLCAAVVGGLEQVIDGFYMNAAIVGMIGQQPPQQSFTNYPMTGFTRVIGSQDFFTDRQMNRMAAGGNYIIVQDAQGAPLIARMALTTDMTSIETRTDSITKLVDFTAKFLRRGLKNFIGRFNINQGFLDTLGHVLEGLLGFLKESGVLIGAKVNNIIQDETAPDTVLIDITLDVPYPCNYIRLTLAI